MNEMFMLLDLSFCKACAQAEVKEKRLRGALSRQTDPTICVGCKLDNSTTPLPQLPSGLPACYQCQQKFLNWPYPGWIKAAMAGMLLLALLAFAANWRFFEAYRETTQAGRAVQSGNVEAAYALLQSSARRVPESADLEAGMSFYHALVLAKNNKWSEAMPLLRAYQARYPSAAFASVILLQAEMAAAADSKDYDTFLEKARALAQRDPENPTNVAAIASAFACKYAVTGDQQFKEESLRYLSLASQKRGAGAPQVQTYVNRIMHRLDTREIISEPEFRQRYPNGWKKGEASR
jgi:hypothetical protein